VALPFVAALLFTSALSAAPASDPAGQFLISERTPVALMSSENPMVSPLTLASASITAPRQPHGKKPRKGKHPESAQADADPNQGLGPERARILLRSLTLPGWGQATLGARGSARVFLLAEAGIWGAFTAFHVQQAQRTESYLLTARLEAGVDLRGRDDEFRRIVGAFASSEEYNLLVVTRDAANLFLAGPGAPDLAGYRQYIADHSLSGGLAWQWSDVQSFRRFSNQRKFAQKAGLRANTALGLAIANRLASALHAARRAGRAPAAQEPRGWRLDVQPGPGAPGALRAALTTHF
jgi:hypothetical protein